MIALSMLSNTTSTDHLSNTCLVNSNLTNGTCNVKKLQKEKIDGSFSINKEEHISTLDKYKYLQGFHSSPIKKPSSKYLVATITTTSDNIPSPIRGRTAGNCSCVYQQSQTPSQHTWF